MSYLDIAKRQLPNDEGRRNRLYRDTVGKLTTGVGRNVDDVAFSDDEIDLMFDNDCKRADTVCRGLFPFFDALTDNRKAALLNLAFNLGPGLSAFHHMIAAVNKEDYAEAARQMKASKWYTQVQPSRSERLVKMMQEG